MQIHAFVLMPDHIHLILTPAPDVSLEKAMQFLKGGYSFLLKSRLDVWERGYRERRIVTLDDFVTARQYIEQNPVRARLVQASEAFDFSSAVLGGSVDPVPSWFCGQDLRG